MDWQRLDLNGLKVLHSLLIERSVAKAAGRLHLSPSAVSHRLRSLRLDFGDPLFVRTSDGMEPTERMRDIGIAVAAVVARLEEATGASFAPQEAETVFRLVVTESAATVLLPELSRLLRVEAPSCSLHVSLYEGRDYTRDLLQGVADLVLSIGSQTPQSATIGVEHLYEDVLLVMVGSRSALWASATPSEADYLAQQHVYSLPWPVAVNGLDQTLASSHRRRRIAIVAPSHAIAADIASTTDLAVTLPARVVRHLCRDRADLRTFVCPIRWAGRVSLEWAPERATTERARFLRALLTKAVNLAIARHEL